MALFPERIETERLELTPLHEVDTRTLYQIAAYDDGIEEVTEYVTWTSHDHPKETAEFLDSCETRWEKEEGAEYCIRPKAGEEGTGEIAGAAGIGVDWDREVATFGA